MSGRVTPITKQVSNWINKVDDRDWRVVGVKEEITIPNSSVWIGNLFAQYIPPMIFEQIGFIEKLRVSIDIATAVNFTLDVNGMIVHQYSTLYQDIPVYNTYLNLYAFNAHTANLDLTFMIRFLPKNIFQYDKLVTGPKS